MSFFFTWRTVPTLCPNGTREFLDCAKRRNCVDSFASVMTISSAAYRCLSMGSITKKLSLQPSPQNCDGDEFANFEFRLLLDLFPKP